jgi:hypothetical protein
MLIARNGKILLARGYSPATSTWSEDGTVDGLTVASGDQRFTCPRKE